MSDLATGDKNKQEIINELNSTIISSRAEALVILNKLKDIKGDLYKKSALKQSIENILGEFEVYTVDSVINSLEETNTKIEEENFNESKSLRKDEVEILVDDYNKHLEKEKLTEEQALNKVVEDNQNISKKNIELLVKRQQELYKSNLEKLESVKKQNVKIGTKVIDLPETKKTKNRIEVEAKKITREQLVLENKIETRLKQDQVVSLKEGFKRDYKKVAEKISECVAVELINPEYGSKIDEVEKIIETYIEPEKAAAFKNEIVKTVETVKIKNGIENRVEKTVAGIVGDLKNNTVLKDKIEKDEIEIENVVKEVLREKISESKQGDNVAEQKSETKSYLKTEEPKFYNDIKPKEEIAKVEIEEAITEVLKEGVKTERLSDKSTNDLVKPEYGSKIEEVKKIVETYINPEKVDVFKEEIKETVEAVKVNIEVENRVEETAVHFIEELKSNDKLADKIERNEIEIKTEIKEVLKSRIEKEEVIFDGLSKKVVEVINKNEPNLGETELTTIKVEAAKTEIETKNWIKAENKLIDQFRGNTLEEKIESEILKGNQNLSNEEIKQVKEYKKLVKEVFFPADGKNIDQFKSEIFESAIKSGIEPGKVNDVAWNNAKGLVNYSRMSPDQINNLTEKYTQIKNILGGKMPFNIKECDSLDLLMNLKNKSKHFDKFTESVQKIFGNENSLSFRVAKSLGLDKMAMTLSGSLLGAAGFEFTKNAMVILAQKPFEEGAFIIMQSFIAGGSKALAVSAATTTVNTLTMGVVLAQESLVVAQAALVSANTALAAATATGTATAAELAVLTTGVTNATLQVEAANLALGGLTRAAATATANLTATSAAAGSTAASIGARAATGMIPVVGWILAAVMTVSAVFKPAFDKVKNFLSNLGLNFTAGLKNFLSDNFGIVGKFGSFVINLAEDILIMVGALMAAAVGSVTIIIFVIVGLFGYQMFQGSLISTMVPPKGSYTYEESTDTQDDINVGPVNYGDYTGVTSTYISNGITMYVFEENSDGGRMGQRYDLAAIDGGIWLEKIPSIYNAGTNNDRLDKRIIPAYIAMVEAARAEGIKPEELNLISGYRSIASQQILWDNKIAEYRRLHPDWSEERILQEARIWVATPGGSPHHTGRAIDIVVNGGTTSSGGVANQKNSTTFKWLQENAASYGFYNYAVEPWHWEYNPPDQNTL